MQWYYANDGRRQGPVPHDEFERLVRSGAVVDDTLVWRQGMNQWQTLAEVKAADPGLIAEAPPPLPEPPAFDDAAPVASFEAVVEDAAPVYAGFWRRVGAYLVDLLLWWFVWQLVVGVIGAAMFPEVMAIAQKGPGYQPKPEEIGMLLEFLGLSFAVGFVWALIYDGIFLSRFSATPGKLLFGVKVVRADGRPLGLARIAARCAVKGLVGFTLGIGYLVAAFDEQKRGLHDYVCDTRVIKKR